MTICNAVNKQAKNFGLSRIQLWNTLVTASSTDSSTCADYDALKNFLHKLIRDAILIVYLIGL